MRYSASASGLGRSIADQNAPTSHKVWKLLLIAIVGMTGWLWQATAGRAIGENVPLHFTVNHRKDFPQAVMIGFNLADVSSVAALDALPDGTKGILWMRNYNNALCSWQTSDEVAAGIVRAVRGNPKFSGIYFIADTPHPSVCPQAPQQIAERTALIHQNDPDGRSFIAVSGGFKFPAEFAQLANAADLIGVVVYPCNTKKPRCEMDKIAERVERARSAGIPIERLVPVFQAFGQTCSVAERKWYRLPTEEEMIEILAIWDELLPPQTRPFDMTYSWGEQTQHACPSLSTADGSDYPDLQTLYARYFASMR